VKRLTTTPTILLFILSFFWSCQKTNKENLSEELSTVEAIDTTSKKEELIYGFNKKEIDLVEGVIKPNENLSEILSSYNINWPEINKAVEKSDGVFNIRSIQTKKSYEVVCEKDSAHTAKCFVQL